jgi:glycogen(starch) synthase
MRVLYWSELFWPTIGGAEIFAAELMSALREHGYEFIVVTSHDQSHDHLDLPDEAEYKGIPIYRFPFRKALMSGDIGLFIEAQGKVSRLKQAFRPDLVHINAVNPSVLFHLKTASAYPAPMLVRMNQQIVSSQGGGPNTLMSEVLRTADWVTCVSQAVLDEVHQLVPRIIPRSSVIYNGIDLSPLTVEPLPTEAPILLCLGRLVPAKGFDQALTALAIILDRFPNVRMVLAGDGSAKLSLEQQTAELGLSEVVEFMGWVEPDKVMSLINSATIVIMPSRREGLPNAAIQAAMMGRPIVATNVSGLPEVVLDGQTGLLVRKDDNSALAEAIAFLLDHPEVAIEMGSAARRRTKELFSWQNCVAGYKVLYQKLIKEVSHVKSA